MEISIYRLIPDFLFFIYQSETIYFKKYLKNCHSHLNFMKTSQRHSPNLKIKIIPFLCITIMPLISYQNINNISILFINSLCLLQTEKFLKVGALSHSSLFSMACKIFDIVEYGNERRENKNIKTEWN